MIEDKTENCVHVIVSNKSFYYCKVCKQQWPKVGHGVPPGPGARLYRRLHAMGLEECEACRGAAFQMDVWGDEGCRLNKDAILKRLKKELYRVTLTGKLNSLLENWLETEGIIKWE